MWQHSVGDFEVREPLQIIFGNWSTSQQESWKKKQILLDLVNTSTRNIKSFMKIREFLQRKILNWSFFKKLEFPFNKHSYWGLFSTNCTIWSCQQNPCFPITQYFSWIVAFPILAPQQYSRKLSVIELQIDKWLHNTWVINCIFSSVSLVKNCEVTSD